MKDIKVKVNYPKSKEKIEILNEKLGLEFIKAIDEKYGEGVLKEVMKSIAKNLL